MSNRHDNLPRLPDKFYQGRAYVHWTHSIEKRATGWLTSDFHHAFREALIHTGGRYGIAFPVYCLMPDHIHILAMGLRNHSDQRKATRFLRKELNRLLAPESVKLQRQPYDNVLRETDRERDAFQRTAYYIAANPGRGTLDFEGQWQSYPYLGSIFPGYPDLEFRADDHWDRFWRIYQSDQEELAP